MIDLNVRSLASGPFRKQRGYRCCLPRSGEHAGVVLELIQPWHVRALVTPDSSSFGRSKRPSQDYKSSTVSKSLSVARDKARAHALRRRSVPPCRMISFVQVQKQASVGSGGEGCWVGGGESWDALPACGGDERDVIHHFTQRRKKVEGAHTISSDRGDEMGF